uniref:F-box domain-containing protein n=1 Tax=Parastrongyloides trichosuri TaxID=131310 RepID=A0A0N4Z9U8_PARTI
MRRSKQFIFIYILSCAVDLLIKPYPALYIKGENLDCIRKGLSLYPIRCGHVYHRLEHEDHCFYHNEIHIPLMEGIVIKRCVNYENGCNFYVTTKQPDNGILVFNDHLQSIVCQPTSYMSKELKSCDDEKDISDDIINSIPFIIKYLDSADLNCLSATSKQLFYHLSSYFKFENIIHIVDRKWIKNSEGKWEPTPFERKFSKVQKKFKFCANPKIIGPLIDHSQNCSFNSPIVYENEKVSTLISEVQKDSADN